MASEICKRLIVQGLVQGVGYRASTLAQSVEIVNLKGSVRNLPNGNVEILVQGAVASVERLIQWAHRGPPHARVERVLVTDEDIDLKRPRFFIAY